MHGGDRDELSKFWSYNPHAPEVDLLQSLSMLCDKQHVRKSWRPRHIDGRLRFPTKEEAAYPELLCHRMASLFLQEALTRGFQSEANLADQLATDPNVGKNTVLHHRLAQGSCISLCQSSVSQFRLQCLSSPQHKSTTWKISPKGPRS